MKCGLNGGSDISSRLEQAMQQPSDLSQDIIVDNLDPKEAARLDKVRNIGIAVRTIQQYYSLQSTNPRLPGAH